MLPPGFVLCFSIYFLKLRGSSYLIDCNDFFFRLVSALFYLFCSGVLVFIESLFVPIMCNRCKGSYCSCIHRREFGLKRYTTVY